MPPPGWESWVPRRLRGGGVAWASVAPAVSCILCALDHGRCSEHAARPLQKTPAPATAGATATLTTAAFGRGSDAFLRAPAHLGAGFGFGGAGALGLALIVQLLAFGHRHLALDTALLEVHFGRDQ